MPYRETITRPADAHGRHKKQSGGHGQFADCKITMEPLTARRRIEFVDEIFGGSIPAVIPAVEKGIQDAAEGVPAGFPVVDFRVRLRTGSTTTSTRGNGVQDAGSLAFQDAMEKARRRCSSDMHVDISAPSEYVGDSWRPQITARSRGRRRWEEEMRPSRRACRSPRADYGSTLARSAGPRSFHMEYSHYEEVPKQAQEKIIADAKKAKEAQAAAH